MPLDAAQIWRDSQTEGVPSSGEHDPVKSEIRAWAAAQETLTSGVGNNGGTVYQTTTQLDADLAHSANTSAWVVSGAGAGIYQKQGAVDAGSWVRIADLPYKIFNAVNAGAGTANAIQADTASAPPSAALTALIMLNIAADNTGAVTLSINSATAKPLVSGTGGALPAGYLLSGQRVLVLEDAASYIVMSDNAGIAAAAAASALTHKTDAETAQGAAVTAQGAAETAQTAAETAEAGVASDAAAALAHKNDAETAQTAAETAKADAETAAASVTSGVTAAETAKTAAETAQAAAEAAQVAAANSFDSFDDRWLGSLAADPTVDNDGDPLTEGLQYWNNTSKNLRIYNGTTWELAAVSATGFATNAGSNVWTGSNEFRHVTGISVGIDDDTPGLIVAYGGGASEVGGEIRLHNGADDDATFEYFRTQVAAAGLSIGRGTDVDIVLGPTGDVTLAKQSGVVTVGEDDTTPGVVSLLGGGAGEEGGQARLYAGADDDTTHEYMRIERKAAGLVIGRGTNDDVVFDDDATLHTKGVKTTTVDDGSKTTGTYTLSEAGGNLRKFANNGAIIFDPPTNECTMVVKMTNGATAGALDVSNWTLVDGDDLTTTDTDKFLLFITKIDGESYLTKKALQ